MLIIVGAVVIAGIILAAFIGLGSWVLMWVLATLLPLLGVTATVTWLHGFALFVLIGFFGSRVRTVRE